MSLRGRASEVAVYGLIAAAVWLGWEMVKVPITDRAPPAIALRLAPVSEEVLQRASEVELAAGRVENAKALSEDALMRAPFNARSLRVLGLATAKTGDLNTADTMLTLAGNWALRDDQTHAWLVERRLRQGNYGSSFAHADTLARRREDSYASVFNFYVTAAANDPRAIRPLADLFSRNPPWRGAFWTYLLKRSDAVPVVYAMAVTLQEEPHPLTNVELGAAYSDWLGERRLPAMALLRKALNRPGPLAIQDGEFSQSPEVALLPFGWNIIPRAGFASELLEDDERRGDSALRTEYDGYATGITVEQVLMLTPGAKHMIGQYRTETSPAQSRLVWSIRCIDNSEVISRWPVPVAVKGQANWTPFRYAFVVPDANCTTQILRLEAAAGDRRDMKISWFDKFRIEAVQ